MNNQMIGNCRNCGQDYCQECSEHTHWQEFCSERCYEEYKEHNPKFVAEGDK